MRPFGWLPNHLKWELRPTSEFSRLRRDLQIQLVDNLLVQRVSEQWAVCITMDRRTDLHDVESSVAALNASHLSSADPGSTDLGSTDLGSAGLCSNSSSSSSLSSSSSSSSYSSLDINKLWPSVDIVGSDNILLDMNPSVGPEVLFQKYEETLFAESPLALFPKQVLTKSRIGMSSELYMKRLEHLLKTPAEVDAKYVFDNSSEASPFIAKVRELEKGMRPLSTVLQELKMRDTQMQVILGLEVLSLSTDYVQLLDVHFDRLCIWQAVRIGPPNSLGEFCMSVLVPFFKTTAPEKVKQLLRRSKGRSKMKRMSRAKLQTDASTNPVHRQESSNEKAGGGISALARALQMQNLVKLPSEKPEPKPSTKRRASLENLAGRTASHPVYRQTTLRGQFEVKFNKTLPRKSMSVARTPVPAVRGESRAGSEGKSGSESKSGTASLPLSPILDPIDVEDDEIGSTDSDE